MSIGREVVYMHAGTHRKNGGIPAAATWTGLEIITGQRKTITIGYHLYVECKL